MYDYKNMQQVISTVKDYSRVALILLVIMALAIINLTFWLPAPEASAENPAKLSDLMADTDLGVESNHTISWYTVGTSTASSTITIDFPEHFRSSSSPAFVNTDPNDFDIATTGATVNEIDIVAGGQCPGDGDDNGGITQYEITTTTQALNDNRVVFVFTHCKDSPVINDKVTTTIEIGIHATTGGTGDSRLINPDEASEAGSQQIIFSQVTENGTDTGTVRVFIIDDVLLTADVDTIFIFTITGVNSALSRCTETTDETSSATTLPFGTMNADTPKVLAQDITVSTNARHGHVVTIEQTQNPLSSTGADIDVFDDGVAATTPAVWSVPADSLLDEDTWGHYGFSTQDSDLNGGEFTAGGQKWAGFNGNDNPDEIFKHGGPADGSTADVGATSVCFQMEITSLQEAANDYTNEITYIATPTF